MLVCHLISIHFCEHRSIGWSLQTLLYQLSSIPGSWNGIIDYDHLYALCRIVITLTIKLKLNS
jgi:hypothetical protein